MGDILAENGMAIESNSDFDYLEYHLLCKKKHYERRMQKRNRKKHLVYMLSHKSSYLRPSIYVPVEYDAELDDYFHIDRVKRARDSYAQRFLKRVSARKVRKLGYDELPMKGNGYRKAFDYWWTWL
ncbi:MAG: hypothetical protein HUJ80_09590 [Firmicutes bacterium]|nr:hypothetical protein [Bacillota bacterium]